MSNLQVVQVVSRRWMKAGYEMRGEYWETPDRSIEPTLMKGQCYTPSGDWIGDSKDARFLVVKKGIMPEKSDPDHCVCSIGFSTKDGKWYGWSHRAICGFAKGDRIFEEEYGDDRTPFVRHGHFRITSMGQAKMAAKAFAESVS